MSVISSYSVALSYSRSTTASPTTPSTTTPPPPPHKHEYERAMSQGRVADADIELLKNLIRASHGLRKSSLSPPRRRNLRFNAADPPRIEPKSNGTSRIRLEWRAYRLYQRCGVVLGPPEPDQEEAQYGAQYGETPKKVVDAMLRQAKRMTAEQIEDELDRQDLLRLRELALAAKRQGAFRENQCSTFRYKLARGEPIITGQFRETFSDYLRPPFVNAARRLNLRYTTGARHRAAIDKSAQIWLWPTADDDGIPLHRLPKSTPRKDDRRSAREKSRPPLRKHAKADRTRPRNVRAKKIPWNYGAPKTPLLVKARDSLFRDELKREKAESEQASSKK